MQGYLLKQRLRNGEVALFEAWKIKGDEKRAGKDLFSFMFFDIEAQCVETLTLNASEMEALAKSQTDLDSIFSTADSFRLVEVETTTEKRGRVSYEVVTGMKLV